MPVQIGATAFNLPAYTSQDFINALNVIKGEIPGLYNVEFNTAGGGGAPDIIDGGVVEADPVEGSFTPSTPAKWGDFYWGSSEWQ